MAARRVMAIWSRIVTTALVMAVGWPAGEAQARTMMAVCEATPPSAANDLTVTAGRDANRAWLTGDRGALRVRKFTSPENASVIEIGYGRDSVIIQLAPGVVRVTRNGTSLAVDSPASVDSLQELLGGSLAMYHARVLLSDYLERSDLRAAEMSLLSAVAFAASLTGDVGAPLRLADRFILKHRGVLRQVRAADEASCWSDYQSEVDAAWNDLQACMDESGDGVWGSVQRLACNTTWALRGESAWFEYLKCLSPLTAIDKLD